ncbi:matrixin family metalloprotease [Planctomycetes bacterium K23_9]|uniref:Matrixin n=1 Tax=Stieleria marina TaxID=1930275 RepID=A0A517NQC0_9BACT|nr:Matrixin [Planctomycetes bacterium K23_9]
MSAKNRSKTKSISVESLESRRLLAAFGTPWPEARDLSISFPADGVAVGQYENDLHQTLDQVADRHEWQELALRAYQTWAIHADINIGLRNDFDVRFGAPGLMTDDPRFGEFRIGAIPQQGLLANSLPFQAVAGTYSGDLVLNSNETFTYHDWADDTGPDPDSINEGDRDLFSLVLHEAGNTLGIDDNLDTLSIMFRQYTAPKGILTQPDIDAIQSLYGQRSDPYESISNDQLTMATTIPTPVGFESSANVIRVRGSLASNTDVDHYEITPIAGRESVSVRLRAAGISLLNSRMEVVDENGNVLAQSASASVYDNDHSIEIENLGNYSKLYLRIAAADSDDIYSVGDYSIEVDYRDSVTQQLDFAPQSYDAGADAIFSNFGLADTENNPTDTILNAVEMDASVSGIANRYETTSSSSDLADVDHWKVTAPAQPDGMLRVNVVGVGAEHPGLKVNLLSAEGNHAGAIGRLHSDGTWTMEVQHPQPNAEYVIRVSVDPNSAVSVGNYLVTAEFETPSAQMNHMMDGQLDGSVDKFVRWTAGKTKLFRFDLAAGGVPSGDSVRLIIYDAHTQEIRMTLRTDTGASRSAFALLQQGDYILRFTALSDDPNTSPTLSYSLSCDGLSDDQDDDDDEPDDNQDGYSYEDEDGSDDGYTYEDQSGYSYYYNYYYEY